MRFHRIVIEHEPGRIQLGGDDLHAPSHVQHTVLNRYAARSGAFGPNEGLALDSLRPASSVTTGAYDGGREFHAISFEPFASSASRWAEGLRPSLRGERPLRRESFSRRPR